MSEHPFQKFMVRFADGDSIFAEGEQGKTMFMVQSGKVSLFREIDGAKRSVGVLEKGDFFGEMSILEGMPRTISAEAIDGTELIEINSTIFDKMLRGNIEIAIRMLRKLSLRLREAELKVSELLADGARTSASSAPAAPKKTEKQPIIDTGVRLELPEGPLAYSLEADDTLIGRYDPVTEQKPDIDLTDLDLKRTVSRRHARIVRTDEGHLVIEEVGALNGTFVNEIKLVPGQGHPIVDGDRLNVGTVSLVFRV